MDKVVAGDRQREWHGESELRRGNGVQIDREDETGVGDDCLHFDGVDEGLGKSSLLKGGEVEAINIIPNCCDISNGSPHPLLLTSKFRKNLHPIFSSL